MAKVTLSVAEMNLVTNQEFILTKNEIIQKIYLLFGELNNFYKNELSSIKNIPDYILHSNPKIYKGENYNLMPWVMLDYPKHFTKNEMFAIRTFFFWGNFMSINLQVQGTLVNKLKKVLLKNTFLLKDWFICIHESPWEHEFLPNNFIEISKLNTSELERLKFIKIAKKIPLQEWDNIEIFLKENFMMLSFLMKEINFQDDEIIL